MLHYSRPLRRFISSKQAKRIALVMFSIGCSLIIISFISLLIEPGSPPIQVPIQVQENPYPEPQQPAPALPPRHHNASAPFAAAL
jgi:hypothetical protein